MWHALYQVLLVLAYPVVRLRLCWRSRREPEYGRRIGERFGRVPRSVPRGAVWFHTVSAGETIAAAPLIRTLAEEHAGIVFLVTTMTPAGSEAVRNRLGDHVAHCYAPYDFRWGVRRFFDAVAPRMMVLMETELWPNLIDEAHVRGVPSLLVNARLSERSARGYRRIAGLTRTMLERLDVIACQYPDHRRRFLALGAVAEKVRVLGSVKFDVHLPPDHAQTVENFARAWRLDGRPVWIAGSTHRGEDEIVLAAHRRVRSEYPQACLILVPRHPTRSADVVRLAEQARFEAVRQTRLESADGGSLDEIVPDVVVGDVMGMLGYLYGLSSIAFVGGSLMPVGGHNPIEPAVCGVPLIVGPHTFNFADVVSAFAEAQCLTVVRDEVELARAVAEGFADGAHCRARGTAARRVVADHAGASERLLELLRREIRKVCEVHAPGAER